ncbi:MAG TPA: SCO family protein [Anaeromyxobacter sp.]
MTPRIPIGARAVALGLALVLAAPAQAQFETPPVSQPKPGGAPPPILQQVGIDERLGSKVPLDLQFVDWNGAPFAFRSVFDGKKPVVLALVYYNCPMLCGLILSGMAKSMRENGLVLGKDFQAVTVSFDPSETPAQGAERRRGYLQSMGLPDSGRTWPFLVGTERATRALADAVGFHYARDAKTGEWAHLAAIFVLAPDGTVSRYLYGIEYAPKDLRLALIEAADGKVGTTFDRLLMTCYRYDPASRKYEPYAMGIMRAGGALVLAALVALIGTLAWRERKAKARHPA